MKSEHKQIEKWHKLDNAARIFSSTVTSRVTSIFRMSVILKKNIKLETLQQATKNLSKRFPYYNVHLKAGLFWHYWEETNTDFLVFGDTKYPCRKINLLDKKVLPFRIVAYKKRISVEFSHTITDGGGALTFLKALTLEYLRLQGINCKDTLGIPLSTEPPSPEESEYSYRKVHKKWIPHPEQKLSKAFHVPFKQEKKSIYNITTGITSAKKVLEVAKSYNASLTEFLLAVLISVYQEITLKYLPPKKYRPIRITVPVNLRKIYNSKTMRNFFLAVSPGIDPRLGEFTFEEILTKVHHYLRVEVDEKFTNQQIARNIAGEKNWFNRIVPLVLKNVILKIVYASEAQQTTTSTLSNIGRVDMPEETIPHIERFDFLPNPGRVSKVDCAVISFNDKLVISFGKMISETVVEKLFFRKLVKFGISVKIETN